MAALGRAAVTASRSRAAAVLVAALILILYGRTLFYGLVWDDFAALRPRSMTALLGAWRGPWDPGGVWPDFYRPMSMAVYNVMFRIFGHHAAWLHAVNLGELWLAALMLRLFVCRETASKTVGLVAAILLVLHPETPSSLAAWISQQFQLVALIWVLTAMLWWQRARHRGVMSWALVLAALTPGLLMKEDVLMVAPALLAWQRIRARTIGDVPVPSRAVLALVTLWAVAYGAIRTLALGTLGGYQLPSAGRALVNGLIGPLSTFGLQWIPSAHAISAIAGLGVLALAVLAWRARHQASPATIVLAQYGVTLGVLANLPLFLISGHTRLYLMTLAAALTLSATVGIVVDSHRLRRERVPRWLMASAIAWAIVIATANWVNTGTFAPCAPEALQRNAEALTWDITGDASRAEILRGMAACAAAK